MSEQAPIYNPQEWQAGGRFFDLYASATSYTYPSVVARTVKRKAAAFVTLDWLDKRCIDGGLSSMRAFDDMLDNEMSSDPSFPNLPDDPVERLAFFDQCAEWVASPDTPINREGPAWVRPVVLDNVELLREILRARSPEDRERVIDAIKGVGRLSIQKAETTNLDRYRELLIEEGRLVAHWVLGTLGHQGRSQDHIALNDWAENIGVSGVLVMAAVRLPKSNAAGRAGLASTLANRSGLFSDAVPFYRQARAQYRTARAKQD